MNTLNDSITNQFNKKKPNIFHYKKKTQNYPFDSGKKPSTHGHPPPTPRRRAHPCTRTCHGAHAPTPGGAVVRPTPRSAWAFVWRRRPPRTPPNSWSERVCTGAPPCRGGARPHYCPARRFFYCMYVYVCFSF